MAAHGHAAADQRNLHLHRAAFARLRTRPELRRPCLLLVERWLGDPALQCARHWLRQWHDMLTDWPIERIEAAALAGESGQELRQCSPLGPALTPRERWAALREINRQLASAAEESAAS
jgi:hypothetical protein